MKKYFIEVVLSFFYNNCKFPIWPIIITLLCYILLISTKEVYKTEVPLKIMFVQCRFLVLS